MDLSKKFLYVNTATDATQDEARTYPASGLKAVYEHILAQLIKSYAVVRPFIPLFGSF